MMAIATKGSLLARAGFGLSARCIVLLPFGRALEATVLIMAILALLYVAAGASPQGKTPP